jgi:hypothetical protein
VLISYEVMGEALKVDGGLMLPPLSRISLQGAPFLLGLDFFTDAYSHNAVFGNSSNPFGRDLGVQLRGGKRSAPDAEHRGSRNPFRFAGRLQLNLLDPDKVFFLRGTYLGEKRMLSFGASYDVQRFNDQTYRSWALDGLFDVAGLTAQFDYVYRNGGGLVDLPKQTSLMAEAGVLIPVLRLSPVARYERRWGSVRVIDEQAFGGGLSFWAFGHTSNLKAFYMRAIREGVADYDQFNAQWQLFFY